MRKDYSNYLEATPDAAGNFGDYGGAFLPPPLEGPMKDIHGAYLKISKSADFINDPCEIWGVEPLGRGTETGDHAATMTYGMPGIIHGFKCYLLQDAEGEPAPVYSMASGLDYPGVGPEHSHLKDIGRVQYTTADDKECLDAFYKLSRLEGIIPALESSHAVAFAMKKAKEMGRGSILVNLSGRGDKDLDFVADNYGYGDWEKALGARR